MKELGFYIPIVGRSEREYIVIDLAEPFKMTLAAVSKHIKAFEAAGLLSRFIAAAMPSLR